MTLILLATDATDNPLRCAVNAMILKIEINKKPKKSAPKNHFSFKIVCIETSASELNMPVVHAIK